MAEQHHCLTCGVLVCPTEDDCQEGHIPHLCDDCEVKTRAPDTDTDDG